MRIIDPGHKFALARLDGDGEELLTFVKREGAGYPGNVGHYPGTNLQECWRAQIARVVYLEDQIYDPANLIVVTHLRGALIALENRAARRHKRVLDLRVEPYPELLSTCPICGHIGCREQCR